MRNVSAQEVKLLEDKMHSQGLPPFGGERKGKSMLTITVFGTPAPQGSKRFVGHAKSGRGIMIESSAKVKPWREAVKWAAIEAGQMFAKDTPVRVAMHFTLAKPASCPKHRLWPDRKPDLSKLVRSTEDALSDAGLWGDDARVISCEASKHYAGDAYPALPRPGAVIKIEAAL